MIIVYCSLKSINLIFPAKLQLFANAASKLLVLGKSSIHYVRRPLLFFDSLEDMDT